MMQPLAISDNSRIQVNTNLSTSLSLTIFDRNGNEILLQTSIDHPIELIIPRDPNIIIPSMNLQNVISMSNSSHYQLFNLHFIDITQSESTNNNLTIAITFEMHSFNINLGYLLIYRFDNVPILNNLINQIDGWTLFCPISKIDLLSLLIHVFLNLDLTNDQIYTYFIDNQQTVGHKSIIYGLRELNSTEMNDFCINQLINFPPISTQPFNFTSNYELRIYLSACYYLSEDNQWITDGLIVRIFYHLNKDKYVNFQLRLDLKQIIIKFNAFQDI